MKITNKKILIFGGTGSLGHELVSRYINENQIYNYSRDESKHWAMKLQYNNNKNLSFIIGDIRDSNRVSSTILQIKPQIIIIAAALKHIDICELATHECINTNLLGTKNVLDCISNNKDRLQNFLETVCFISTDKACSPVNIYGMCKASSEVLMIERAFYDKEFKFVTVRYGNVLNSRGSIIPILHEIGKNPDLKEFKLTHPEMTRFVMTLAQSVDLVEHAILNGESGDILIPKLVSMNVKDLLEIFSEIYKKPIVTTGLRPGEKMLESLINETQSIRLIVDPDGYTHIKPHYYIDNHNVFDTIPKNYNSTLNPLDKDSLYKYMDDLKLLEHY